jgi:hypothetical protein
MRHNPAGSIETACALWARACSYLLAASSRTLGVRLGTVAAKRAANCSCRAEAVAPAAGTGCCVASRAFGSPPDLPRKYQAEPMAITATRATAAAAPRGEGRRKGGRGGGASRPIVQAIGSKITEKVPTGSGMFLTASSPRSSKSTLNLPRTVSRTPREMQMPPGAAMVSKRAATLTVSPYTSPGTTITSPALIPMRNRMRLSSAAEAPAAAAPDWTSTAARTASTALSNVARKPSPVHFTTRPWFRSSAGVISEVCKSLRR